jgi:hypothetical protein
MIRSLYLRRAIIVLVGPVLVVVTIVEVFCREMRFAGMRIGRELGEEIEAMRRNWQR